MVTAALVCDWLAHLPLNWEIIYCTSHFNERNNIKFINGKWCCQHVTLLGSADPNGQLLHHIVYTLLLASFNSPLTRGLVNKKRIPEDDKKRFFFFHLLTATKEQPKDSVDLWTGLSSTKDSGDEIQRDCVSGLDDNNNSMVYFFFKSILEQPNKLIFYHKNLRTSIKFI